MAEQDAIYSTDLAGIVVGDTQISDVQGDAGILGYRGIDINDMIGVPVLLLGGLLLGAAVPVLLLVLLAPIWLLGGLACVFLA